MNKLFRPKRVEIIKLLVEGMSLRAVTRATGVSINTVTKLLVDAGKACSEYQDRAFRGLQCRHLQIHEIWAFAYCKAAQVKTAKSAPSDAGDIWTYVALDADTKLIPSWLVGRRDYETARVFVEDIERRVVNRMQITSDGHRPYLTLVPATFRGAYQALRLAKARDGGR